LKTFLEKYDELSEFRVVSKAQRKKIGLRMKRMAKSSAFKAKKKRMKLRIASPEKILMKARKLAKQKVLDKFYPNYKAMGLQQRVRVDQIISMKYGGMIDKISKKVVRVVKKKEVIKVKKAREAKKDA
tara:strand:+ start:191 stop:574 length:384 start_codon:yes stop_codon:yes gene_type:complete